MRDRVGYGEDQRDRTGDRRLDCTPDLTLDRDLMAISTLFDECPHTTTKGRGEKVHPQNRRFHRFVHTSTGGRAAKVDPLLYGEADLAWLADVLYSGGDSVLDRLGNH